MSEAFADTAYFVATLDRRDALHARADVTGRGRPLVTTDYILVETANFFARPEDRPKFVALVLKLRADESADIVPASDDLFTSRPDKGWSLTDCISFVVMGDYGLTDALTADHHYRQAGFRPLLADDGP